MHASQQKVKHHNRRLNLRFCMHDKNMCDVTHNLQNPSQTVTLSQTSLVRDALWGHPFMTSQKITFLTPSPCPHASTWAGPPSPCGHPHTVDMKYTPLS